MSLSVLPKMFLLPCPGYTCASHRGFEHRTPRTQPPRRHGLDDRDTKFGPVAVAKHGVPLTVLVEDKFDRLIGDRLNLFVKRLGKDKCRAAVYNDNTFAGHDETEVVVMARIFVCGRCGGTNG